MIITIPSKFIDIYVNLINLLDIYYDKGYALNYEHMTHAHFKESNLYQNIIKLPNDQFLWGYYRDNYIENI